MNGPIQFKPLSQGDIPRLHEWLNHPHVAAWWGGSISYAEVQRKYEPRIRSSAVRSYIAHLGNRPFGFAQAYRAADTRGGWWPDEHDRGVYGVDVYIGDPDSLGRGLGAQMIRAFVEFLFAGNPEVTRIQADPAPHNVRAIGSFLAAGFREKGIVDTPDGKAMLMVMDCTGDHEPRC